MKFTEVPARGFESLDSLREALARVDRRSEVVETSDLTFHGDGRLAVGSDEFSFTRTGARSLFGMLSIPERFVTSACPSDLAATVVNELLSQAASPIEIRLRDAAITSVHAVPGPHLWHHELLHQCGDVLDDPVRIELSECGLRVATRKADPVGVEDCDPVYLGHHVTHSEDGFEPLASSITLFRQVCENGAELFLRSQSYAANLRRTDLPEVLVGLRRHLQSTIDPAEPDRMLKTAAASRSTAWERTRAEVRRVTGAKVFDKHPELQELHPRSSAYDVFNAVTLVARDANVGERQRLESLAGELLVTLATRNGTPRSAWRRAELAMIQVA